MDFIKQIFSDVDGQGSSKRLAAFWILVLISLIAIGNAFFKAFFNANVWESLVYLFAATLLAVTSEKFTKRGVTNNPSTTENESETNSQ
jgi:uncharacterized protein (DUF983 family)